MIEPSASTSGNLAAGSTRGDYRPPGSPSFGPRRVTAHLNRRYLASFGVAAALLLANQLLVQRPLLRLATDGPVINVAGRQRMLSQRLVKAALALSIATDDAQRTTRRTELREVLRLWTVSQRGLRDGNLALSLPGDNSLPIAAALERLQPDFNRLRAAAAGLLDAADGSGSAAALEVMLQTEGPYLQRMDRIVDLYAAEARARATRLLWIGWVFTGLTLLTLAAVGVFVLAPAARLIGRQMLHVRQARDLLEQRVQQRTAELQAAAVSLQQAQQERRAADERHRQLLERFSHAARVNSMGEMASGLAHELNQPLGTVANYVGGCLERLAQPTPALPELQAALVRAQAATLRAGEIVRRIRRFATRHEHEAQLIAPKELVAEVVSFLAEDARERGVLLEPRSAPNLPLVLGDAVQLQQVLVNLIHNAADAMAAPQMPTGPIVITINQTAAGDVRFAVTDSGPGIPADQLDSIFDPFYSTRAAGMGMGLAISRSIVEAHQGRIGAESMPLTGTTVWFTLPEAPRSSPSSADAQR